MIVRAMPPDRLQWLCSRSSCEPSASLNGIEAIDSTGKVRGAIGYNGWLGNMVQMHIALDSPVALRSLLGPMFEYPFVQQGKEIAIAAIPSHNHRSLRLATHVGFRVFGKIEDGYAPGDDVVLLEMRKADCRWIGDAK